MLVRKYISLILWMVCCTIGTISAQNQGGGERAARTDKIFTDSLLSEIHFRWDKSDLDPRYLGNDRTLQQIDRQIDSIGIERIDSVVILSQSSPEGSWQHNQRLSERRAATMLRWMTEHHPALSDRLTVNPDGESWEQLRRLVLADERLKEESIERVVRIIDDPTISIETRKWRITHDPVYRYLYRTYYPHIRNSMVCIIYYRHEKQEPIRAALEYRMEMQPASLNKAQHTLSEPKPLRDTLTLAAKTNLLYDALTVLNVELELPIRNHWSVAAEYAFPWWEKGNKHCLQMLNAGIEARYWFRNNRYHAEKLRGHFLGLYGMSAKYDFQWDRDLCYQGEGWSVGLTYGYSLKLSRHLNMEFSISVGYLSTAYRHYFPADDYSELWIDRSKQGRLNYFGPTKLKVSLVWPIQIPYNKKRGGDR